MIDAKVFNLLNAEAKGVYERAQMRVAAQSPARASRGGRVFRK